MNHIHLIGPGGAGKSTIAPMLAESPGLSSLDLDAYYTESRSVSEDVQRLGMIHPAVSMNHGAIKNSSSTVCLLPSWDLETCVSFIVERQMDKSHYTGTAMVNERVIRDRFELYSNLGVVQIEPRGPVGSIVAEIVSKPPSQARGNRYERT